MGFSVSGATAIILLGIFIAFGTMFTVVSNGYGSVVDAEQERSDRLLEQQNTAIEITAADSDGDTTTVTVDNTGSTELTIADTTVLLDGAYVDPEQTTVEGTNETNLWLPEETLIIEIDDHGQQVKVVTETGVAATAEVS